LTEFTGERAIPGQVDVDLLNEHVARYMFAARLARGKRVLDAGCGAGYGSAELALTAQSVTGLDRAAEALDFARAHYQLPNLFFERASCAALPHPGGAFDLVVAFEVIEHLEDWRGFLLEARRVLAPTGQFIVSTPNKLYYAESRGAAGANPFHVHEFGFEELRTELTRVFPHVSMFLENHVEGLAFQPDEPDSAVEVRVDTEPTAPANSHFFVAVCAHRTQLGNPTFVYVPGAANLLRERQRHIALLEREISTKDHWLAESERQRQKLHEALQGQAVELERSNRWAEDLDRELQERRAGMAQLQSELERSNRWAEELNNEVRERRASVTQLQAELERSNRWAEELNREVRERRASVAQLQAELERSNQWAEDLDREVQERRAAVAQLQAELERSNQWAEDLDRELQERRAAVTQLQAELERSNQWAEELDREVAERRASVTQLQAELEKSNQWARSEVARLKSELERSNLWAGGLDREVAERRARILELQAELAREQANARAMAEGYRAKVAELEADLAQRAAWANGVQEESRRLTEEVRRLAQEARTLEEHLENVRSSPWVKLGRKIRMGPAV
jgi:SAM-dependent methyltransferase